MVCTRNGLKFGRKDAQRPLREGFTVVLPAGRPPPLSRGGRPVCWVRMRPLAGAWEEGAAAFRADGLTGTALPATRAGPGAGFPTTPVGPVCGADRR